MSNPCTIDVIDEQKTPLYIMRQETWSLNDEPATAMDSLYAHDGSYIGTRKELAPWLDEHQIRAERIDASKDVASVGQDANGRWWGWSHRAASSFPSRDKAVKFALSVATITELETFSNSFRMEAPRHIPVDPRLTYNMPPSQKLAAMLAKRKQAILFDQFGVLDGLDKNIALFCELFQLTNPLTNEPIIEPVNPPTFNSFSPAWVQGLTAKWLNQCVMAATAAGQPVTREKLEYATNWKLGPFVIRCSADSSFCFSVERDSKPLPLFHLNPEVAAGHDSAGIPKHVLTGGNWKGLDGAEVRNYIHGWQQLLAHVQALSTEPQK